MPSRSVRPLTGSFKNVPLRHLSSRNTRRPTNTVSGQKLLMLFTCSHHICLLMTQENEHLPGRALGGPVHGKSNNTEYCACGPRALLPQPMLQVSAALSVIRIMSPQVRAHTPGHVHVKPAYRRARRDARTRLRMRMPSDSSVCGTGRAILKDGIVGRC